MSGETESNWRDARGPAIVALLALLAVLLTLDAAGTYPKLAEGPGITLDESFNVQMGVYQWRALREYNLALLHPDSVREVFGPGSGYNPDHPPLGRLWLGVWHDLTKWLFPPADHPPPHDQFVTVCARVGSAMAFAITVFLVGWFATKWYGRTAGVIAAVSLLMMPRVFSHAHLASLETCMNLTYTATILAVGHWWKTAVVQVSSLPLSPKNISWKIAALTGVLFGLALLTKMQAILIPPVIGLWALWHWRGRAIAPLVVFGLTGLAVFLAGWPWLWLDVDWPWLWFDLRTNFREYFARTTSRAVLNCYYLGQVWADKDVPWHYPFVMFAVTVPLGLQVLGAFGCRMGTLARLVESTGRSAHPTSLVMLATLMPLVLFALPGVAVYDGERLFLISFPMWSVLIGRGGEVVLCALRSRAERGQLLWANRSIRGVVLVMFIGLQVIGLIVTHPCQLSYYNLLVGGSSGAERLGFERTYWGDSITRSFLQKVAQSVPEGSTIQVAPVLHQFQLPELVNQSPILRARRIHLAGPGEPLSATRPTLPAQELVFARKADLPADAWPPNRNADSIAPRVGPSSRWLTILRPIRHQDGRLRSHHAPRDEPNASWDK